MNRDTYMQHKWNLHIVDKSNLWCRDKNPKDAQIADQHALLTNFSQRGPLQASQMNILCPGFDFIYMKFVHCLSSFPPHYPKLCTRSVTPQIVMRVSSLEAEIRLDETLSTPTGVWVRTHMVADDKTIIWQKYVWKEGERKAEKHLETSRGAEFLATWGQNKTSCKYNKDINVMFGEIFSKCNSNRT